MVDRDETARERRSSMGGFLATLAGSPLRHLLLLAADGVVAPLSLLVAYYLRFEGNLERATGLAFLLVLVAAARMAAAVIVRSHRWSFRFSGLADAVRVLLAGLLGSGLFLGAVYFLNAPRLPRSVVVMELLMSLAVMGAIRFSPRYAAARWLDFSRGRTSRLHTLIAGAGAAGEMLLRDLQRSNEHQYVVVGFVDDDTHKRGEVIGGKTVLGTLDELPWLAAKHHVEKLLIAIPRLAPKRLREILSMCAELGLRVKSLPVSFVYIDAKISASMLQDLQPDDLLPRVQVDFSDTGESGTALGRRVLVTGAAGSIGGEICRQLLRAHVKQLVMVDINENELYLAQRRLESQLDGRELVVEVADIRDAGRMRALFERYRPEDVFHAAAHKHVPLMEAAPCEAVKNNVGGTRNVARAAHELGADRCIYISTDKAVRPTSVMGASKRVGEMVVRALALRSPTAFKAVRFGNVLGSAGSVVPIFREQIARGGPVTVTDPEVRRYFMTISEAVGLVLRAGYGGCKDLCVLDMGEQIRIDELARHMIIMAGRTPDVDIKIEYTGLRPGEKLYEELLTEDEEKTHQAMKKVFTAVCPPPPFNLEERLDELERAAAAEDAALVIEIMRSLVPSYTPQHNGHAHRWQGFEATA
ncbi:MAG: polysaccharide biosynthesis protein [Thermoanaerobaculaceae bacterium]|nr:polysaccharide biosynthesis protein [Thermoanaerobaculaceae bacterium]NLH10783.1 polysaccharide biosynthesis protein [Holophagae bacterium]